VNSGIGKAMVEKLVGQGLNVVLVALDDDMLANTHTEMYVVLLLLLLLLLYCSCCSCSCSAAADGCGELCRLRRCRTTKHPTLQFIKVGVDLSDPNTCMAPIVEATKDLDVSLVFNNAGFITTGFFAYTPIGRSVRCMRRDLPSYRFSPRTLPHPGGGGGGEIAVCLGAAAAIDHQL